MKYTNEILAFLENNTVKGFITGFLAAFISWFLFEVDAPEAGKWIAFIAILLIGSSVWSLALWIRERAIIAMYKRQTTDVFIYSNGTSEIIENDNTIRSRVDQVIKYMQLAKNKHGVTIWYAYFRDAYVFGIVLDSNGNVKDRINILRIGITVRETRDEFNYWFENFRAEKEQEKIVGARTDNTVESNEWVDRFWFNQNL